MQIENFLKLIDKTNEWTGRIVSYLAIFMMLSLTYEVVVRYLFNMPTIWVLEINQYALCIYVALAGGFTAINNGHVNVEILYEKFSPRRKAIVNIATSICFFAVLLVLIWKSGAVAWEAWETKETSFSLLAAPLYPAKAAIPIGAFLFLLQQMTNLIRDIAFLVRKDHQPVEN